MIVRVMRYIVIVAKKIFLKKLMYEIKNKIHFSHLEILYTSWRAVLGLFKSITERVL